MGDCRLGILSALWEIRTIGCLKFLLWGISMKQFFKINRFLNLIGILLAVGFVIRLWADYYKYHNSITSAPFYVFIIGRSIIFLFPSVICFIAAVYYKNKHT